MKWMLWLSRLQKVHPRQPQSLSLKTESPQVRPLGTTKIKASSSATGQRMVRMYNSNSFVRGAISMSETIFTNEKIVPDWARGCEIDAEPQAAPSSTEVKLTSESQPQLLVPVEAINLVVRAFGESRRAAVSRMPLKQLRSEEHTSELQSQ